MDGLLYHRMEVITVEMVALLIFCPLVVRWVSGSEWRMCVCLEKMSQSKMRWGVSFCKWSILTPVSGVCEWWESATTQVNRDISCWAPDHHVIPISNTRPKSEPRNFFTFYVTWQNICQLDWLQNPRERWRYKKLPLLPRRLRHSSSSSNIVRSFLSLWNDCLHPVKSIKCDWGCLFPPKQLNMHIMFMALKFAQIIPVCCGVIIITR